MRRVLTFDEVLLNMRRDEAKAARVKATLDRPATSFQQSQFNPQLLQALMTDVQQSTSTRQALQEAQQASQATTGLPHQTVSAVGQAQAQAQAQAPLPSDSDDEAVPKAKGKAKAGARAAAQAPLPSDSDDEAVPKAKGKAKAGARAGAISSKSKSSKPSAARRSALSPIKAQLKEAAAGKLGQAVPRGTTIRMKPRGAASLASLQMVADVVPMQNVTDIRGAQLTSQGKRSTPSEVEGTPKRARPAPSQAAAQQPLGTIYARAANT